MARNSVQFQKGLSEAAFEQRYGTEAACREALFRWRWPEGFECPICGERRHSAIKSRQLFQCSGCRRQTSLTAGTIFAATKVPLRTWFRAIYHVTQTKQGISGIELGRRLGVTQTTAWTIKHKLGQVMLERDAERLLTGRVELDDAYLGGERSGGKRGRGSSGKTPFLAAVETTPEGKPVRLKLRRVTSFCSRALEGFARRSLDPACEVVSDGLGCFAAVHQSRVPAYGHQDRLGRTGGTHAGLQVGQHRTRQHEGRNHRHLSLDRTEARAALPRRVRVSVQPPLRSRRHAAAPRHSRIADTAHALSAAQVG